MCASMTGQISLTGALEIAWMRVTHRRDGGRIHPRIFNHSNTVGEPFEHTVEFGKHYDHRSDSVGP